MATKDQVNKFIDTLSTLARAEYLKRKKWVLPSVCIAQAALETGWGTSSLMEKANAYFGIKAGSGWNGKVYSSKTKECYDGVNYTTITDTFRAYNNLKESVADYYDLICNNSRYAGAVNNPDAESTITAIRVGGYATSPTYIKNVMAIINGYNLTQYDIRADAPADRNTIIALAKEWLGKNEADGSHKAIIDIYNGHKPLARGYTVKYADAWCATFISALSIQCSLTSIIPTECGCGKMVELFKSLGEWVEDDARVPLPGDVIFYDWQDSGKGDNEGNPDHVGLVETVANGSITVIEGNYSNAVKRRTLAVDGKYIRGYGVPKYAQDASVATPATSTVTTTAKFKPGDKVKVDKAETYNGVRFATYYADYDVIQVNGDRVVIGKGSTVTAAVASKNLTKIGGTTNENTATKTDKGSETAHGFKKGGKVKVVNAFDYYGNPFKAWYNIYDVIEVTNDRVVIGIGKTVTAAVNAANLANAS